MLSYLNEFWTRLNSQMTQIHRSLRNVLAKTSLASAKRTRINERDQTQLLYYMEQTTKMWMNLQEATTKIIGNIKKICIEGRTFENVSC